MASDPPDTDQVVRAASRRVHRTKPGNPANDPVALALFIPPSHDDHITDAWARPPHATPVLVSADGRGPGPETTPGDRRNCRGAPAPANTLAAMFSNYAAHVDPHEALPPLAYAGPWSSGPPPVSGLPYITRPAPAPSRTQSRADDCIQARRRAQEWAIRTLTRGSAQARARAFRPGPVPAS